MVDGFKEWDLFKKKKEDKEKIVGFFFFFWLLETWSYPFDKLIWKNNPRLINSGLEILINTAKPI